MRHGPFRLRLKKGKWRYYLNRGVRKWLRECEKIINEPEVIRGIRDKASDIYMKGYHVEIKRPEEEP